MSTVQLPGSNRFDSQMQMYTGNQKDYVGLSKELQHFPTKKTAKMVSLISSIQKTIHGEKMDTESIMFRIVLILKT